jgi:type I restriction enzyme S subunit
VVKADGKSVGYVQTLNEDGLKVSKLFQPTIVLVTIAANIGDTAILDYPACFTDSVVGLNPFENMDVYFLEYMMRKQRQILNESAPKVAQKNINIQILNRVKIPVPPISEQKKLVAKIKKLEQKINQAQITIKDAPQRKQQILDKYLK